MKERNEIVKNIFSVTTGEEFSHLAMDIFFYQARQNSIYRSYINNLGKSPDMIKEPGEIPFLPASFFKTHQVKSGCFQSDAVFNTSGTTGNQPGRHYIRSLTLYEESLRKGFEYFYGDITDYCVIALIPESSGSLNSSLFYMATKLIKWSGNRLSGFYRDSMNRIADTIQRLKGKKEKALIFGVSYAILDYAEKFSCPSENLIVIETGGMKGRRKELTREDLHNKIGEKLKIDNVHSEYGMTELMSQAYSKNGGRFYSPPWMRIVIRDMYDPFEYLPAGKSGAINIIDLANIDSCSFIETSDLGKTNDDGTFEVLGRFDHSDLRGCSLLME